MKYFFSFVVALICVLAADAQIGYQVSLINNATGEARANETVNVTVELSYEGCVLLSETKSVKTNDFGVLSLSVGDATTFQDFDWNKLPLYISTTVDGILVGKSQILTVPVAQHALHTGTLTKDFLCSKNWVNSFLYSPGYIGAKITFTFNEEGSAYCLAQYFNEDGTLSDSKEYFYEYFVSGDTVLLLDLYDENNGPLFHYVPERNVLINNNRAFR